MIYGRSKAYPRYRVAYRVAGQRKVESFRTFSEALAVANEKARELNAGNQRSLLSAREISEVLSAKVELSEYRRETGQDASFLGSVTSFLHAMRRLQGTPLSEIIDAYQHSIRMVHKKPLADAVDEFNAARQAKTVAESGKRPALHPTYVKDTTRWLREFSRMLPSHHVNELERAHVDLYLGSFDKLSAKSRNDRRNTLKMFFRWCSRKDYLATDHRLLDAEGLRTEPSDSEAPDFYRPNELRALLENPPASIRPVIALQALAGLRLQEALRLDWADVFGIAGNIEVSSAKSKTRARRLVEICPSLEQWLQPYRGLEGKVAGQWQTLNGYMQAFIALRKSLKIPSRKNGLRHGFCSYHFALHQNENLTAAMAGNTPAMVHQCYKGLATKSEALAWFATSPAKADNIVPLRGASAETH